MSEQTNKELMKHDSDVAGSLLVLLGEGWKFGDRDGKIPFRMKILQGHLRLMCFEMTRFVRACSRPGLALVGKCSGSAGGEREMSLMMHL